MREEDHPAVASLYDATYGILFFASPHKGLMVDDMKRMLTGRDNHPRGTLLEQINQKSDLLLSQLVDFKNLIRDRRIVSFYEMKQTRRLQWVSIFSEIHSQPDMRLQSQDGETHAWRRTGDFYTAVDGYSAKLELSDQTEVKIPLDADHSGIVKFDSTSAPGYGSALDKLKQFEQSAPSVVAGRFSMYTAYDLAMTSSLYSSRPYSSFFVHTYHTCLESVRTTPRPSSTVPFMRDSRFVPRGDIFGEIDRRLTDSESYNRMALVGLGGVG
jgi:hypothetical protein